MVLQEREYLAAPKNSPAGSNAGAQRNIPALGPQQLCSLPKRALEKRVATVTFRTFQRN